MSHAVFAHTCVRVRTHTHTHTHTHVFSGKETRGCLQASPCGLHGGQAVVRPLAWLQRGAGSSRHCLRFQALLAAAGGCGASRATNLSPCWELGAPPAPPDAGTGVPLPVLLPALGATRKQGLCPRLPSHGAGTGGQEPPSSSCLALEKTQQLVVSVAKLWLCGHRIGHFHHLPVFVPLGAPLLLLPIPPIPRGPSVWLGWGVVEQKGVVGAPTAPLRNPQPAPGSSSRSQQEPADLAAASEGGGMEGGRKAARDQNGITTRERGRWRHSGGDWERGLQQSSVCREGESPCSPDPSTDPRVFTVSPGTDPCALLSAVRRARSCPSQGKSPCAPRASLGMLEGLPGLHGRFSSSGRNRAGGSCRPRGSGPAAVHGMAHSQALTLFSI